MPYIKQEDRKQLDAFEKRPSNAGELNYHLHTFIAQYIEDNGECYQSYNDVLGALEGIKLELYRRRVSKYENKKMVENGDIDFYATKGDMNSPNVTHAVVAKYRKGGGGIVASGSKEHCVKYCEQMNLDERYSDIKNGVYADEDTMLTIVKI